MDISWYRDKIMHVPKYSSPSWHAKVNKMSNRQIMAIYHKFKERGLFDKRKTKKSPDEKNDISFYQMTIFDYLQKPEEELYEDSSECKVN